MRLKSIQFVCLFVLFSLGVASRYPFCIPGSLPHSEVELHELYDGVETFVMFIGYPRSSHSLLGAILDAHPEIIIPHEYHIIDKWDIYQEETLKSTGMQKYLLFYNLHSLSTWQATFGNRAREPAFLEDGIYSYNVPGAWQGTLSGKVKVIYFVRHFKVSLHCLISCVVWLTVGFCKSMITADMKAPAFHKCFPG